MKLTKQRSIMAEFINADKNAEMLYFKVTNAQNFSDLTEFELMAVMDLQDQIVAVITAHNSLYDVTSDKAISQCVKLEALANSLNEEFNSLIDSLYDDISERKGQYKDADTYAA